MPSQPNLRGVELRLPVLEERLQRHRVLQERDDAAVLGRDIVGVVGGAEPARRRHVLHHHGWVARDVVAEMASDGTAVGVIAAAGRGGDDQGNLLAAVEIGRALGKPALWFRNSAAVASANSFNGCYASPPTRLRFVRLDSPLRGVWK